MERAAAAPQNAPRNQYKPRGGRRRKYPALKDQKTCLMELRPPTADRVSSPNIVPGPSCAQTPCPSHAQRVSDPSSAKTVPGPSHAQTSSSVQPSGSVIGQEVEGVLDGAFQDGFLISIKVGEMTLKGVVYGLGTNESNLAPEGQTVQQPNNNDVQESEESQGHDEMVGPWSGEGGLKWLSPQPFRQVVRGVEAPSLELPKHISNQLVTETVRNVQLRSRNSGGGTSSNPTKHQDKVQ